VKDKAKNEQYRQVYTTCHRQYSLGVTFTQRFWDLSIRKGEPINSNAEVASQSPGYIGMITANSFMKREFGKKLIEEFFPKIDLTQVIDTSGAYIPGHGTPTVILFGRARQRSEQTVRAVLGIKGEPSAPDEPAKGLVWQSILQNIEKAGLQDDYTSSADMPGETFAKHPWSIGGGGAADIKEQLEEQCEVALEAVVSSIGFMCITKQDDVFPQPRQVFHRANCEVEQLRPFGIGEEFRDWGQVEGEWVIYPYDRSVCTLPAGKLTRILRFMWPYKTVLENRKVFGGQTYRQAGKPWYEYGQIPADRQATPLSIAFAFVATHNHFVLDRGGKVFKQSAPIIKLPANASEDDHLALLGLLNSSTACFWMKQTLHGKGGGGIGGGIASEGWEEFFEYTGTGLQRFPVTEQKPLALSRRLDEIARQLGDTAANRILERWARGEDLKSLIEDAEARCGRFRSLMIALQEELDWECYRHYALLTDDLCYTGDDLPELKLGQRAFEIVMARQIKAGELQTAWFARHGSTPIMEIPKHWPAAYRKVVERRIKLIETNKEIGLIEKPEYKRRWNTEPWAEKQGRALKNWLLDRLEDQRYWPEVELQSTARLADRASTDAEFMQVAALYRGRPDFDVTALVAELVEAESIPFLPVLRYKATGLRKRVVWDRTWDLQRQEDKAEGERLKAEQIKAEGGRLKAETVPPSALSLQPLDIPVPPKYTATDFLKTDYWRLRGKLDVPKERWVSYPHCSTENDPSLVVGWAGWDHLQQATALIAYYDARKRDGWTANRLTPLLAGLDQLLPWIHQWHPEIDKEFGETAGQSYQTMLEHDAHELGLTLDEIRQWTPPATTTRRRARK
jgi:hypothetical protein